MDQPDIRCRIVYGCYEGVQKTAVEMLYGMIAPYVPYVLTATPADETNLADTGDLLILIGTCGNNAHIRSLRDAGCFEAEDRREGYSIAVIASPWHEGRRIAVLQGADDAGTLYAAADFECYYIRHVLQYDGYHYNRRHRPFIDEALPFARRSAPAIEHRGLWSWGHVIYDYRGYIENMSRCKLNTLILWNDFAPLNAADIVAYAHLHAVKIIWGFSWSWGEEVVPSDAAERQKWAERVLQTYEQQYAPLGGDGIYFQTFTETGDTSIDGRSIAELAVDWVSGISRALYARYPDLWVQFGLHATSIQEAYAHFSRIDPRMSIVWEDAGGFPYQYDPRNTGDIDQTLAYTQQLLALRGAEERFGAVLKGFTVLNWKDFEHQKGPFVLGCLSRSATGRLADEKQFYWRYAAPYWINQADAMRRFATCVAEAKVRDRLVMALVEDGVWEHGIHVSAALYAALLWNPDEPIDGLLEVIMHAGYAL